MPTGRIDNLKLSGNSKIYLRQGDHSDIPVKKNADLNRDSTLIVPNNGKSKASICFIGDRHKKVIPRYGIAISSGTYTFPCQMQGKGLTCWGHGSAAGCSSLWLNVKAVAGKFSIPSSSASAPTVATSLARSPQEQAIEDLVSRKIMTGYRDGSYRPNERVTRAEFASLVSAANFYWNIPETDRSIQFHDVAPNHWAHSAIARAVRISVLSGYPKDEFRPDEPKFRPDELISRQQVLAAIAKGLELPVPADIPSVLRQYQDENLIDTWAKPRIAAATEAGLILDTSQTQLKPQQNMTRGETAIIIAQSLKIALESFEQPETESTDAGFSIRIAPHTQEVTLVQIDAPEALGADSAIVINSLTSTIKVMLRLVENGAETTQLVQVGQRYIYQLKNGVYEGSVRNIDMAERRSIVQSEEVQSFLNDWTPEAQAVPKNVLQKLFTDRLLNANLNGRIEQAMKDLGHFSTLPFIPPGGKAGENSCGWAVNQVLAKAGIGVLHTYVPTVEDLLKQGRGMAIDDPKEIQAGDIVIASGQEHMGICLSASKDITKTVIRSAGKTERKFSYDSFLDRNFELKGTSKVYRLQS
jgi:S-layer homology domain